MPAQLLVNIAKHLNCAKVTDRPSLVFPDCSYQNILKTLTADDFPGRDIEGTEHLLKRVDEEKGVELSVLDLDDDQVEDSLHPQMLTSITPHTIANFFQVSLHKSDISDEDIELFLETDTAFFLPDVDHLLCLLQKVPLHSDLSLGITIFSSLFRFPFLDSSIFCLPRNTTTITKANEHHIL